MTRSAGMGLAAAILAATMLSGCGGDGKATPASGSPTPVDPPSTSAPAEPTEPSEPNADKPQRIIATPPDPRPFSEPRPLEREMSYGDVGEDVRELQVRLRHTAHLAVVDVTDSFGDMTLRGVTTFQADNGLPQTGVVNQETWDALLRQSHDPSPGEMNNTAAGPWWNGPNRGAFIRELQWRFKHLGIYDGPVDGDYNQVTRDVISEYRRGLGLEDAPIMDERATVKLREQTPRPSYWDLYDAAPEHGDLHQDLDPRCESGVVVCISKSQKLLSYVVDGETLVTRHANFARPGYESPTGDFRIWFKKWDEVSYIFGERTPMAYAMYFNSDIAIHYSDSFADYGYDSPGSHGCTQMDDLATTMWLYEELPEGTRVIVYD